MIITTIDLLNYLRCRRYAALDTRMTARQMNGLLLDEKFTSLKNLSVKNNYQSLEDEEDAEEISQKRQLHQEVTSKALQRIKTIAFSKIKTLIPEMFVSQSQRLSFDFSAEITLSARFDFMASYSDDLCAYTVFPVTDRELGQSKFNVGKEKIFFFSKNEQGIFLHEKVKISPNVKSNYSERLEKMTDRRNDTGRILYDLAFKAYILKKLYPHQTIHSYLVLLNKDYHLDVSRNVLAEDQFDLLSIFDLTSIIDDSLSSIDVDLYRMLNHINLDDDTRCLLVKNECQRGTSFECQFCDYCFSHIPKKNSVFNYFMSHLGFSQGPNKTDICHDVYELVNEGMVDMLDVPISWLQREKNLMQRYCVENNYTFVNKPKIKALLETLVYPIYYLDFEAYPAILPRFQGESPYTQSVFQFSVHKQTKKGLLDKDDPSSHFEYLAPDDADHREELIKKLLEAIPHGTSSVIVYNKTFEKNRLYELSVLFPKYQTRLMEISERLFDLLRVLKNDYDFFISRGFSKEIADSYNFYHPDLSGSYSLKKVLPVFDAQGYENLPIANGMNAYLQYARLSDMVPSEKAETIRNLLAYCKQDTYSMFVILNGIENLL